MKKVILSSIAIAAIILASCSKKTQQVSPTPPPPPPVDQTVKIVSDWLTMNFIEGEGDDDNSIFSNYHFSPTIYDETQTTTVAFMRTADGYYAIPSVVSVESENMALSYNLDLSTFTVIANSEDGLTTPDAAKLGNQQFRFIVVSNSLVQAMNINWSDYSSVAAALEIND